MNTRNILYGTLACAVLIVAAACTDNSADDSVYEDGIDKNKIILKRSIDKNKIILKNNEASSIDKNKIRID